MGSAHASRARASGYGPLNDPLVDVEAGVIDPATGPVTALDEEALVVRAALLAAGCVQ